MFEINLAPLLNLQRTPLFDILAGSWALERNLGRLGRALMNDEYFRRCIFNIDHAQNDETDAGLDASSRLLRHSRGIYHFTGCKNFLAWIIIIIFFCLSTPYEHWRAWLKAFLTFSSNEIFHRSMRFSFEPKKCHPYLVIHSAFFFLTVIRILTIPRIVCLYDPFFTREMCRYRFAEKRKKKKKKKLEYYVYIIIERNRSL